MRVLLAGLGAPGFVFPLVAIAGQLRARGHDVAFVTDAQFEKFLSDRNLRRIPRGAKDGASFDVTNWSNPISGAIQVRHTEYALETFCPDVVLCSHLALGPLIVRERHHIPVAVLGSLVYLWPASRRLIAGGRPINELEMRLVWRHGDMLQHWNSLRKAFGMAEAPVDYEHGSLLGDRYYVQGVPSLQTGCDKLPDAVRFVGACILDMDAGPEHAEVDAWVQARTQTGTPVLYANFGRTFDVPSALPFLFEWIRGRDIAAVVSIERYDRTVSEVPDNVLVMPRVSQDSILRHAAAVVCTGHPTPVLGALRYAKPMLLLPNGSGTDDIAERCALYGCAVSAPSKGLDSERFSEAIDTVMTSQGVRRKARALSDEFAKYDGPAVIADDLEMIAASQKASAR